LAIKSSILSDRQKAVIETIRMRLTEKQRLEDLKEVGFDIGPATFYREKKKKGHRFYNHYVFSNFFASINKLQIIECITM
jgi:hypothetical protein